MLKKKTDDITFGHCYIATEAAYHIIGKSLNYKPYVMRVERGKYTHWFLKNDMCSIGTSARPIAVLHAVAQGLNAKATPIQSFEVAAELFLVHHRSFRNQKSHLRR